MNTRAGWKFQGRNPASEPASTAHRRATRGSTGMAVREMTPRVSAAMSDTPVDSPSRPSIQLMQLIMPTIQRVVSRMGTGWMTASADAELERREREVEVAIAECLAQELERVGDLDERDAARRAR